MSFSSPLPPLNDEHRTTAVTQIESLRKKCDLKTEAVLSLSKKLAICQEEREKWEATAAALDRSLSLAETSLNNHEDTEKALSKEKSQLMMESEQYKTEAKHLKEENDYLKGEVKDLRSECKALRQKIARYEVDIIYKEEEESEKVDSAVAKRKAQRKGSSSSNQDVSLLENFEKLNNQNCQLQRDLQSLLCEKEELICDRDTFKGKVERLSSELTYLLNGDQNRIVLDIDGVLAENRYLKAQLEHAQEESGLTRATLKKYRRMLKNKLKGNVEAQEPTTSSGESFSAFTTQQINKVLGPKAIELRDGDYHSLCGLLLDCCNDKQIALTHQRNANKILGHRVTELEAMLKHWNAEEKSPDRLLPRRASFNAVSVKIQCDIENDLNDCPQF